MRRRLVRSDLQTFDVVLFDVGNVLFYDGPVEMAFSYFVSQAIQTRQPSARADAHEILQAAQHKTILSGCAPAVWADAIATAWSRVLADWRALSIPIPGSISTLQRIYPQRMAIVANQPREMLEVLAACGVTDLVEAVFLDSAVGKSKPDVALYRSVLSQLQVRPERALMIGDRLDNDIEPAQRVGIATAWVQPPSPECIPSVPTVPTSWRRQYLVAMERRTRTSVGVEGLRTEVTPDFVLNGLTELRLDGTGDRNRHQVKAGRLEI